MMNWIEILIVLFSIMIVIGILFKMKLKRRLDDIDGFYGVHKNYMNLGQQNIIGSFESGGHHSK